MILSLIKKTLVWTTFILVCAACNDATEDAFPISGTPHFPIALSMVPDASGTISHVAIANSNFDLRYNSATLQLVDVDALASYISNACPLVPCNIEDVAQAGLLADEVRMASYASSMQYSAATKRLYIANRTEKSITHIDVDSATASLSCGATTNNGACSDDYRSVEQSLFRLPADPLSLLVDQNLTTNLGQESVIWLGHRFGELSVIFDDGNQLQVQGVLETQSSSLSAMRLNPIDESMWIASTDSSSLLRVRANIAQDAPSMTNRLDSEGALFETSSMSLQDVDGGQDIRDIAFTQSSVNGVADIYLLTREPNALLQTRINTSFPGRLEVKKVLPLGAGASRLEQGSTTLASGASFELLFASIFNSKRLNIYDARQARLLGVVRGMSGPFASSFDRQRNWLWIADFRGSVVHVVDLTPTLKCAAAEPTSSCDPRMLVTLGQLRIAGDI